MQPALGPTAKLRAGCQVAIPQASTRKDGKGKPHTVFHITVMDKVQSWVTLRRFSQFDRVHKKLQQKFHNTKLPSLPPKKWIGALGLDFVDKRRNDLEKYLRGLMEIPSILDSPELGAFLHASEYAQGPRTPELPAQIPVSTGKFNNFQQQAPRSLNGVGSSWSMEMPRIIVELSREVKELRKRCEIAEHTANTAIRIAQLAAGSLTQESKRKLQRRARDEMKALSEKRATLPNRRISADLLRERNKKDKFSRKSGHAASYGEGDVKARSTSWLPGLTGAFRVDSDSDDPPEILSVDRKRYKRRPLGDFDGHRANYLENSIWGPSIDRGRFKRNELRPRGDSHDTLERLRLFSESQTRSKDIHDGVSSIIKSPSQKDVSSSVQDGGKSLHATRTKWGVIGGPLQLVDDDGQSEDEWNGRRRAHSAGLVENPPAGLFGKYTGLNNSGIFGPFKNEKQTPGDANQEKKLSLFGVTRNENPKSPIRLSPSPRSLGMTSRNNPIWSALKTGDDQGPAKVEEVMDKGKKASDTDSKPAAEIKIDEAKEEDTPSQLGAGASRSFASVVGTGKSSDQVDEKKAEKDQRPLSSDSKQQGARESLDTAGEESKECLSAPELDALKDEHRRRKSPTMPPKSSDIVDASTASPSQSWMTECVIGECESILRHLISSPQLSLRRRQALELVTDLIRKTFGAQVYVHGSYALKTDLPESDVDVSAYFSKGQSSIWVQRVVNALCQYANASGVPRHLSVRSVTFVNAEVPIVKVMIGRIPVDISGNQVGALEALALCEACNRVVGKDHLLKKTIILFKAWARNEAGILGSKDGMLSSYCLRAIVLFVFNAFHKSISNPIDGLYRVFSYLESFPWPKMALGLFGPIYIKDLPEFVQVNDGKWAWPKGEKPLFSSDLLQRYSFSSRPHRGEQNAFVPKKTSYNEGLPTDGPKGTEFGETKGTAGPLIQTEPNQLVPRLMTVMDPSNPFNNLARSVTSFKHAGVIQRQLDSAAQGMRAAAIRWETESFKVSKFVASVLFLNTVNRYRSGGAWGRPRGRMTSTKSVSVEHSRNGIISDTDHYTETEVSNFSGPEMANTEPYSADLSTIEQHLHHARQFEAPSIGEEQLVALVSVLLHTHGSVPIGKMGSMLHNATNNHSLPAMIKAKYGGLKRFLLSHSDIFRVGVDHPFNPPVTLLTPPSAHQHQIVEAIVKSSGGSLAAGGGSKLPPKPAGMGNRRDRSHGAGNSSAGGRRHRRTGSPSSVKSSRSNGARGGRGRSNGRRQNQGRGSGAPWAVSGYPQNQLGVPIHGSNEVAAATPSQGRAEMHGFLPSGPEGNVNKMKSPKKSHGNRESKNSRTHPARGRTNKHGQKPGNRRNVSGGRIDQDEFPPLGR